MKGMDFLNGFGRKVNKVMRSVTEKTTESAGLARISAELRALTADCDRLFSELGHVCYALQAGEGDPGTARELCERIDDMQARIAELREQREALREPRRCPACGAVQGREHRYCSNCGKRLPEDAPVPAAPDAGAYCPECGAAREGGEARCAVCGRPFEGEPAPEPPGEAEAAATPDIDTEEPAPGEADEAGE